MKKKNKVHGQLPKNFPKTKEELQMAESLGKVVAHMLPGLKAKTTAEIAQNTKILDPEDAAVKFLGFGAYFAGKTIIDALTEVHHQRMKGSDNTSK